MNATWIKHLPAFIRNKLNGRHRLQKVIANTGWLFADKILRMGVGLVVGVWVARYLGPERFGQLSYAIAFAALFVAIATLGMDSIVVRDLVRNPEQKDEILGSAFALKFMGGCVAFLAAFAVIWLVHPMDTHTHWLVGIIAAGMIFQTFDIADLWFQSQVQSKFTVITKNAAFLVLAAVKVWLILTKADVEAFAWAATAEIALGALGLIIVFQSTGNAWVKIRPVVVRMTSLLKESWPLLLSGVAITIYVRINQIMLAEMIGEREVGVYSAALRLSEVWYVIPIIIVSSVMPALTEERARSKELYYQRLQQLFTNLVRVAYLVAIPTTFLASPLINFLYGESYSQAGSILAVHIWAAVFVFLGVARGIYSINEGLNEVVMFGTICGAVLNILLNFFLIPRNGALGAAIATIISYGFSDVLFYRFVPSFKIIYKMMLSALTLGIVKGVGK